ncbi:MAG: lamin tail domain-containing protein [Phycisphaerales bacterium]|jgi:hypothetical protein|nr:lamin tail domain-containing protein [Phycisphaerales bacterium]
MAASLALAVPAAGQVVISQVYSTGGAGGSTTVPEPFDADFVELFNPTAQPVNVAGWSLQALNNFSPTGNFPFWKTGDLTGVIPPGGYLLVQIAGRLSGLPYTPDLVFPPYQTNSAIVSNTSGMVGLRSNTIPFPTQLCPAGLPGSASRDPTIIDFVGWGTASPTGVCAEGAPTTGPSSSASVDSLFRINTGCTDTNVNAADFTLAPAVIRNSSTNAFVSFGVVGSGPVLAGGQIGLTVSRSALSCNPLSPSLASVTVDTSALDGIAGQRPMSGSGEGPLTLNITTLSTLAPGEYGVPVIVTDQTAPVPITIQYTARVRVVGVPPANDTCTGAIVLASDLATTPFVATIDNTFATDDTQSVSCQSSTARTFVRRGVWYRFTAPTDGALVLNETSPQDVVYGIFGGTPAQDICPASGTSPLYCLFEDEFVNVPLVAGRTYSILIGTAGPLTIAPSSPIVQSITFIPAGSLVNDTCAGAIDLNQFNIESTPYTPVIYNRAATIDSFSGITCNSGVSSAINLGVWFKYTPPVDGRLELTETGPQDSIYAVFQGPSCPNVNSPTFQCITSDTLTITTLPQVFAGQTYYILLGQQGVTFPNLLNVQQFSALRPAIRFLANAPQTACETAIDLNAQTMPFNTVVNNLNAPDALVSAPCNVGSTSVIRYAVWYRYTAPVNGRFFMTESSIQNVVYAVFRSPTCPPPGAMPDICPFDPPPPQAPNDSSQQIRMLAGETYFICIGLQGASASPPVQFMNLQFNFTPCEPPSIVVAATSVTVAPTQTATLSLSASGETPMFYFWQRETAPGSGVFVNLQNGDTLSWDGNQPGIGARVSGVNSPTLTIAPDTVQGRTLGAVHAIRYRCIITNLCASRSEGACLSNFNCATLTTTPVTLSLIQPCSPSDVAGPNQSTGADGALTADDIIVFLGWYFAGDSRADVAGANQSTSPDEQFTADDIIVFLGRYFTGC